MDKPQRKRARKGSSAVPTQTIVIDEADETHEITPPYQSHVSALQNPHQEQVQGQLLPTGQPLPSPSPRRSHSRNKGSDDDNVEFLLPRPPLQIHNDLHYLSALTKELHKRTELTAHEINKNKDCMMADAAQNILAYIDQLMVDFQDTIDRGNNLLRTYCLHGFQIEFLRSQILRNLYRYVVQVDIYREEVNALVTRTTLIPARLFLESKIYNILKPEERCGHVEVRLLTGACVPPKLVGFVKADIIPALFSAKNKDRGQKVERPLTGDESPIVFGVATFENLKCTTATGNRSHQLGFSVVVQKEEGKQPVTITSPLTEPFVVMTNISQWSEIENQMFKDELFRPLKKPLEGNSPGARPPGPKPPEPSQDIVISPAFFCNCTCRRFLLATKQDPSSIERQLMDSELLFLLKRSGPLNPSGTLSLTNYQAFWEWYGPVMQLIKFHRFMLVMWLKGLLWGFISKKEAEFFLSAANVPLGTFIIRFSEANSGSLAIAYKQNPGRIRHYLLKNPDWKGSSSLPQFLRETSSFVYFYQLISYPNTAPYYNIVPKETALKNIDQRRRGTLPVKDISDYDTEVQRLSNNFQSMSVTGQPMDQDDSDCGMEQWEMDSSMVSPMLNQPQTPSPMTPSMQPSMNPMSPPVSPSKMQNPSMSPSIMNPMPPSMSPSIINPMSPSKNPMSSMQPQSMNPMSMSMQPPSMGSPIKPMQSMNPMSPMNSMQGSPLQQPLNPMLQQQAAMNSVNHPMSSMNEQSLNPSMNLHSMQQSLQQQMQMNILQQNQGTLNHQSFNSTGMVSSMNLMNHMQPPSMTSMNQMNPMLQLQHHSMSSGGSSLMHQQQSTWVEHSTNHVHSAQQQQSSMNSVHQSSFHTQNSFLQQHHHQQPQNYLSQQPLGQQHQQQGFIYGKQQLAGDEDDSTIGFLDIDEDPDRFADFLLL